MSSRWEARVHVNNSRCPVEGGGEGSEDFVSVTIKFTWSSRGAFCCAFPVNFSLIRETAGMRLRRFPSRELRKKRSSKIRREKQWFEYLRQPFFSFFLLLRRWKRQILEIIVWCVEGSYFQNAKDCSSLVSWFSGRSMKMMLFLKDASGLSKSTKELDSILLSCHCYLKLSVIIWSTRLSVSVF